MIVSLVTGAGSGIGAATDAAVAQVVERHGGLDVAVACAGIEVGAPAHELDPAVFARVVEVNLHGSFLTARAAARGQGRLGLDAGPVPDAGGGDPTVALSYLKAAASKVELIGSEQLRGTPTTRYAVTVDAAKVAAQVPEEFQGFADESGLAFPKPADVWIDQQGRLRKIHYTVTMNAPGEATPTAVTIESTLELYDFGVPVHVTPPPANQVEVIRSDIPPPGCTPEKGDSRAGSSDATSPDAAQGEVICPSGLASGGASGTTTP